MNGHDSYIVSRVQLKMLTFFEEKIEYFFASSGPLKCNKRLLKIQRSLICLKNTLKDDLMGDIYNLETS